MLDFIKWLAITAMVLDHSRAIWPSLQVLAIPGRLAFPLFCLVMACNVIRQQRGSLNTPGNVRYLGSLLFFGVISQPMFHAVFGHDLNIFWLLSSALTITLAVHHRTPKALLLGTIGAILTIVLHDHLGYHAIAVLIPAVMVMALRSKGAARWAWVTASCVICCLANMLVPEVQAMLLSGEGEAVALAVAALAAPLVGFWLVSAKLTLTIRPVGRWGYLFYPMHLGLFALLRDYGF
ncbi:TraX family protein [Pseudomonas sp. GXZC]|uniref:TraX family protein n=1 Tax=Pseudomonas sp. GXZC TaxID=3003351 RepID=UPI0022AA1F56|nr:TraX family protein [Pseudomonas sp. GXZC]WAT32223.1 TraX family protein [Pseudomonas sp. GXZC]